MRQKSQKEWSSGEKLDFIQIRGSFSDKIPNKMCFFTNLDRNCEKVHIFLNKLVVF